MLRCVRLQGSLRPGSLDAASSAAIARGEIRLGTAGPNKSRYRGVSYDKKKRKWRVQIKVSSDHLKGKHCRMRRLLKADCGPYETISGMGNGFISWGEDTEAGFRGFLL